MLEEGHHDSPIVFRGPIGEGGLAPRDVEYRQAGRRSKDKADEVRESVRPVLVSDEDMRKP